MSGRLGGSGICKYCGKYDGNVSYHEGIECLNREKLPPVLKMYIAAHSQLDGLAVDTFIQRRFPKKLKVISDWLYLPFLRTADHSIDERRDIAFKDTEQVKKCDIFIIVCD